MSTIPASSAAPFSSAPASISRFRISRLPSSRSTACKSTRAVACTARATTSTPARSSARALGASARCVVKTITSLCAERTSFDFSGRRSRESTTARSSFRRRGSPVRSVSSGSSASTVPIPVSNASDCVAQPLDRLARRVARDRRCAARALRDSAVERERGLQGDEREAGANPLREILRSFPARDLVSFSPEANLDARALEAAPSPRPATRGFGSSMAATTRATARGDDGFRARPGAARVQHGSRLT